VALVFDFDGTLAPIVDNPAEARMAPQTRKLLLEAAQRISCASIPVLCRLLFGDWRNAVS
jgi:trehalose-6-phosphatase